MRSMLTRWPLAAQLAGGATAVAGVYLLAGLGVALLLAGLAVAAVGALREAGLI